MELGLTTAVQNKIKDLHLVQAEKSDPRFWWEVNLTKLGTRNALVIVHPSSRYCMIYSKLKPSVWKNLSGFVTEAITDAFLREGFSEEDAKQYLDMAGEVIFTKTHGRKATGGLNRITSDLYYFNYDLDLDSMYQEHITYLLNDEPSTNAFHPEYTCIFPQDYFVNEMKNLLHGTPMKLHCATKKGGIIIRDGQVVER